MKNNNKFERRTECKLNTHIYLSCEDFIYKSVK